MGTDNFKYISPGFFRLALKSGLHIKVEVIENYRTIHQLSAKFGDDPVVIGWEDIAIAMPAAA